MTCSSQLRWQEAATLLPHLTPAERSLFFFVGGGGQSSDSLAMLLLNATKQKPGINPFKILESFVSAWTSPLFMPPPKMLPVCCHFMLSLMCAGRVLVSTGFDPHTLVFIVITDSKRIKEVQCGKPNKKLSPQSPEMDGRNHVHGIGFPT